MSTRAFLQAFGTVFPAELPDKTMLATIVLVTRYRRPFPVWVGAISAFAVHVTVAVTAGRLIGLLPRAPVQLGVATMFLIGAVLLFRAARGAEEIEADSTVEEQATLWANVDGSLRRQPPTPRTIVAGSFGLTVTTSNPQSPFSQTQVDAFVSSFGGQFGKFAVGSTTVVSPMAAPFDPKSKGKKKGHTKSRSEPI